MANIEKTITIEELIEYYPTSVRFLMKEGIHCMACGEPVWGTLEAQAQSKGFNANDIDSMVKRLNQFLEETKDF